MADQNFENERKETGKDRFSPKSPGEQAEVPAVEAKETPELSRDHANPGSAAGTAERNGTGSPQEPEGKREIGSPAGREGGDGGFADEKAAAEGTLSPEDPETGTGTGASEETYVEDGKAASDNAEGGKGNGEPSGVGVPDATAVPKNPAEPAGNSAEKGLPLGEKMEEEGNPATGGPSVSKDSAVEGTGETARPKKRKGIWKGLLQSFAAAIAGSAITLAAADQMDLFHPDSSAKDSSEASQKASVSTSGGNSSLSVDQLSTTGSTVADIVEKTSKAIVGVVNLSKQNQRFPGETLERENGSGSGFIYKAAKGEAYIVTNHHVIDNADKIEVSLYNGKVLTAELVGSDELTDLAVLKIKGNFDITPLSFGDSDQLRVGDPVLAIGNPLGLELSRTVTQGIVSGVNRSITVGTSLGSWDVDVIQTDAAINPGNSGGPLINLSGKVVGITSLKISQNGVEGLGFAIPSNQVVKIVNELMEKGQVVRPYLGVGLAGINEIPPYYQESLAGDVSEGAVVLSVDETSPAAKAGIQVKDIIVSIDGKKVKDADELRKYLYNETSPGDTVTIKFYRDGKLRSVKVKLASTEERSNE
ncbi:trypsin-like peptidase domain-containing protein [Caldibacillus debilis]|uniref:trypsin-like peptidase domain-containing protein n=1 Tax=Caldibacillus debilis TaxID=301148 RepID=UPI002FDB588C